MTDVPVYAPLLSLCHQFGTLRKKQNKQTKTACWWWQWIYYVFCPFVHPTLANVINQRRLYESFRFGTNNYLDELIALQFLWSDDKGQAHCDLLNHVFAVCYDETWYKLCWLCRSSAGHVWGINVSEPRAFLFEIQPSRRFDSVDNEL